MDDLSVLNFLRTALLLAAAALYGGCSTAGGDAEVALYLQHCVSCHGEAGDGRGARGLFQNPRPLSFTDDPYVEKLSDGYLFDVIKFGQEALLAVKSPSGMPTECMHPFGDVLGEGEIRMLAKHVGSLRAGADSPEDAEKSFKLFCVPCHGDEGRGDGTASSALIPPPPDFHDAPYMRRFDDSYVLSLIKHGRGGVLKEGYSFMPGFGQYLSDQEIRGLVSFVRSFRR